MFIRSMSVNLVRGVRTLHEAFFPVYPLPGSCSMVFLDPAASMHYGDYRLTELFLSIDPVIRYSPILPMERATILCRIECRNNRIRVIDAFPLLSVRSLGTVLVYLANSRKICKDDSVCHLGPFSLPRSNVFTAVTLILTAIYFTTLPQNGTPI